MEGGKLDSKGLILSDTDDSFSGIFRIHNAWCSGGDSWDPKPEKTLCKISCSGIIFEHFITFFFQYFPRSKFLCLYFYSLIFLALRSDDITKSVICARKIYKVKKYRRQEWGQRQPEYRGRLRRCLDALPNLRKCLKK